MKVLIFLVIVLLPILSIIPLSSAHEQVKEGGFSINLIHRHYSLNSPYYNASMNKTEILINAALRSISRMKSIRQSIHNLISTNVADDVVESEIYTLESDYLMDLFLGNPPVESLAIPDTGSSIIWFQCLPCHNCYKQPFPIYNPDKSTTHKPIPCNSDSCKLLHSPACGLSPSQCMYTQHYGDGSYSIGELATDTIAFQYAVKDKGLFMFPNTIMGCGHDNNLTVATHRAEGIVGLGPGPLSLISQNGEGFAHTFSYCLIPDTATSYHGKLFWGSNGHSSADRVITTPFITTNPPSYYFLTLEGVYVNGKVVRPNEDMRHIVIDSGASHTFLETSAYNIIEGYVKGVIDTYPVRNPISPYDLCYRDGTIEHYPNITFQFSNAEFGYQLTAYHMFATIDNQECFLIFPSNEISIFGSGQQSMYQVEYNLEAKTVSFAAKDCRYV